MPTPHRNNPTPFARALRRGATPTEKIAWALLRDNQLSAYSFRRQHPIHYYTADGLKYHFFADFFCLSKKLIIELDGGIHEEQKEYDERRDNILKDMGYHTMRFKNEEVYKDASWLETVKAWLDSN